MEEKMRQDVARHVKNFNTQVSNILKECVLWDLMSMSKYEEYYKKTPIFWIIFFKNLQDNLLLNLHEIFNEDSKNLNAYLFIKNIKNKDTRTELEKIISQNSFLKSKIKNWRNNLIAHKDKKTIDKEIEYLGDKYHIIRQEIIELVNMDLMEINKIACNEFDVESDMGNVSIIYKQIQEELETILHFEK
jgi:hypothetical protein